MGRIRGARKVSLVASVARRGQSCVVIVHMALSASHGDVRAGQRERGVVVIEGRVRPRCGVVAGSARCRKTRRNVIWIVGIRVICRVAGIAISRHRCVIVVHMALCAWHGEVRASQRKCPGRMIKCRRTPAACGVAERAVRRETRSDVIGIYRAGEISLVAGITICRRRRVVVICMALCAGHRRMSPRQRIIRIERVIEFRVKPVRC